MSKNKKLARAETGRIQFGDDWPGIFIRGDNAAGYGMALENLLSMYGDSISERSPILAAQLQGLRDELLGSHQYGPEKPLLLKDINDCLLEK